MTKQEALTALEQSGAISTFRESPAWIKAFELYNSMHTQKKRMSCGTCFRDVLAWLKS